MKMNHTVISEICLNYDKFRDIWRKCNVILIWVWLKRCVYDCSMYLRRYIMYIKIECEFTSNKTRGSRMNKKTEQCHFNVYVMVKRWWTERKYFKTKVFIRSYLLSSTRSLNTKFEDKFFLREVENVTLESELQRWTGHFILSYVKHVLHL